jgi:hypothetical protein
MDIQFLYFEDCPSHEDALERLQSIMAAENVQAKIQVSKVETEDEAVALRFTGSPTIRINGTDIDPVPEDTPYNLSCRVYRHENGRFSPLPSENMIRSALRAER